MAAEKKALALLSDVDKTTYNEKNTLIFSPFFPGKKSILSNRARNV